MTLWLSEKKKRTSPKKNLVSPLSNPSVQFKVTAKERPRGNFKPLAEPEFVP